MGTLVLEGGAEFGGGMAEPDRQALTLAGGLDAPVLIVPTAAAPDQNHVRAGNNGVRWFRKLGAGNVETVPLIDRASAADSGIAARLREAKLIYLLGGFTHYLGQTLRGSLAWEAVLDAYDRGAVVVGSSAGAMVLCEHYVVPRAGETAPGLNLVPNACVLPHHNTFGQGWAAQVRQLLPEATLLGIDEGTGMVDDGEGSRWRVLGAGAVTVYAAGIARAADADVYAAGERFSSRAPDLAPRSDETGTDRRPL